MDQGCFSECPLYIHGHDHINFVCLHEDDQAIFKLVPRVGFEDVRPVIFTGECP